MKKNTLVRKYLTIGVILIFIGTNVIPLATAALTKGTNIITVDDEPGDADFTSIKEAVNASNPGDTIEVYSGTYPEQMIYIKNDNITLRGIAHELGGGSDTGKPFIQGNVALGDVLRIESSQVLISNFLIENSNGYLGGCIASNDQHNITISECVLHTKKEGDHPNKGIGIRGNHIQIIHNEISFCSPGISAVTDSPLSITITGNVITDCGIYGGIVLNGDEQNISGNRVLRCAEGIRISGTKNVIYGNEITDCPICVESTVFDAGEKEQRGNIITQNNFRNYSFGNLSRGYWWTRSILFSFFGFVFIKKDQWVGNYWDSWIRVGPMGIRGWLIIGFVFVFYESGIGIAVPWFEYDRHPAKEPYDIP
jgi:parallel beta-helix repeat protein